MRPSWPRRHGIDAPVRAVTFDKKTFELLVAQMTVFEALSSEDKKQVMLDEGLDMTNTTDIMARVVQNAQKRGLNGELLDVMQQFLLIS